jgi:hypothetical protein
MIGLEAFLAIWLHIWLVVDLPLWKLMEFVSWDDEIPNIWKVIKSCSKPPTSMVSYVFIWFPYGFLMISYGKPIFRTMVFLHLSLPWALPDPHVIRGANWLTSKRRWTSSNPASVSNSGDVSAFRRNKKTTKSMRHDFEILVCQPINKRCVWKWS